MDDELLTLSATALAGRIRDGRATSRQVVEAHIRRIEAVNPALNAVVAKRFDAAREEADEADRRAAEGPADGLPPLHGVPCTIKEAFALSGMPNTSGLVSRKGLRSSRDAPAVARLREAGAIPLGVTNTSELCMWMESANKVWGRTRNAYDGSRIAGGSSGGEGAIVGAGGSPFGLGSDIGGSIRMPAFFNGVFGHKPSSGLVPNTGQFPIAEGDASRFLATGPLCRRAEDLMPLLRILAGPDGVDPACETRELGDPESVSPGGLRLLVPRPHLRIGREMFHARRRVAAELESAGAKVEEASLPPIDRAFEIWSAMLSEANVTSHEDDPGFSRSMAQGSRSRLVHSTGWVSFLK